MVLVLLFVFYTSFMLYFGASFIKVYSDKKGWGLHYDRQVVKELLVNDEVRAV